MWWPWLKSMNIQSGLISQSILRYLRTQTTWGQRFNNGNSNQRASRRQLIFNGVTRGKTVTTRTLSYLSANLTNRHFLKPCKTLGKASSPNCYSRNSNEWKFFARSRTTNSILSHSAMETPFTSKSPSTKTNSSKSNYPSSTTMKTKSLPWKWKTLPSWKSLTLISFNFWSISHMKINSEKKPGNSLNPNSVNIASKMLLKH